MSFELALATAYLTTGALLVFLGIVLLRENPGQRVNRATAGMLVFGGLGPILGAYESLAARASARGAAPGLFAQFAFLWEFFFPTVLFFSLVFPSLHPVLRRWPRIANAIFVPHLFHVLLVLVMTDTAGILQRVEPSRLFPIGESLAQSMAGVLRVSSELALRFHVRFFSFVNLTMAAASWIILMRSAARTLNPKLRAQVRAIRAGLGVSLALYSGGELLPKVFGYTLDRAYALPLVTVSLLVGAISIVVAIVRLGFLDVRFIVRRGLVYGFASGVIVALYLFAGKQMDRFSAQLVGTRLPFFETTFLVLSLLLLQPVLSGLERLVDQTHARDRSDLRNALMRLTEEVALLLDSAQVCGVVATTIRREMVLTSASVAARDRASGKVQLTVAREKSESLPDWEVGALVFQALEGRRDSVSVRELVELPRDPRERASLAVEMERLGAELAIPLYATSYEKGGELVGVAILGAKETGTRIMFEETALVSLIAHQVGISLMNGALHQERLAARLLEEEVATARKIQEQLLPMAPPTVPGWELCASNSPSRHVGGDYHDFLALPGGEIGIAIADVSGKGVPAALLMSNLQAALRVRVVDGPPPERVVADLNHQVFRSTGSDTFITLFLGHLRPACGTFTYTNAGHNAPVVVRSCGKVELLDQGGLLLGVFPDVSYERGEVHLEPGDCLTLYTDGVTEASDPEGELFSDDRLRRLVVSERAASAEELHGRILEEVKEFQRGRPLDDDLTLIVLKRTGPPFEKEASS